mmetsp:Transcript_49002/g.115514  ORF Transcript_49002/g.115514 Transcript_49002/m.115514 type:complete len:214 (-) Transcript_49002:795-1436(-)
MQRALVEQELFAALSLVPGHRVGAVAERREPMAQQAPPAPRLLGQQPPRQLVLHTRPHCGGGRALEEPVLSFGEARERLGPAQAEEADGIAGEREGVVAKLLQLRDVALDLGGSLAHRGEALLLHRLLPLFELLFVVGAHCHVIHLLLLQRIAALVGVPHHVRLDQHHPVHVVTSALPAGKRAMQPPSADHHRCKVVVVQVLADHAVVIFQLF